VGSLSDGCDASIAGSAARVPSASSKRPRSRSRIFPRAIIIMISSVDPHLFKPGGDRFPEPRSGPFVFAFGQVITHAVLPASFFDSSIGIGRPTLPPHPEHESSRSLGPWLARPDLPGPRGLGMDPRPGLVESLSGHWGRGAIDRGAGSSVASASRACS